MNYQKLDFVVLCIIALVSIIAIPIVIGLYVYLLSTVVSRIIHIRRYSLRGLLIVTTVFALALGVLTYALRQ